MSPFATLPRQQRADFFNRYEEIAQVHPVIAEKDFWVVWLLGLIFSKDELGPHVVFKGAHPFQWFLVRLLVSPKTSI